MGAKSKKKGQTRLDAYYRLAKDQGYRSRAAYKLIQLNRKYDFLGKCKSLVDLCAAPGGWCQVAAKHMPVGSKICGVDLVPIHPIRGVKTFVGDITDDKTRKIVMTWLKKEPVDCVVHDGAPNVGGVWSKDLFAQNSLVLCSLKLACSFLKTGGWFVSKVFRSPDFHKLMWLLKQFFEKVEATKPLASRMESAEIFVVCHGYLSPKNIDPKLFSAQHVFSEVEAERVMLPSGAMMTPPTKVPQGFDIFNTIETRVATMTDFLTAENPKEFLKYFHEIRFEGSEKDYLKSKYSKRELVYLCGDLQQVSSGDLKKLLRWREQLLKQRGSNAGDDDLIEENDEDYEEDDRGSLDPAVEQQRTDAEVNALADELINIRKRKEREQKKKQEKIVGRKLKQVRGLLNHDVNEAKEQVEDRNYADVGNDIGAEDTQDSPEGWNFAKLKSIPEHKVAEVFDKHDEPDTHANLPLADVSGVDIDAAVDIDMGGDGDDFTDPKTLHVEEGNEDDFDVDNYGNYIERKRSQRGAEFAIPGDSTDDDNDDAEDVDPTRDADARTVAPEDSKESKWKKRHRNIDAVLNSTFPKFHETRQQKRLRETASSTDDVSAKETPLQRRAARELLAQGRLHDESDASSDEEYDSDISDLPSDDGPDGSKYDGVHQGRGNNTRVKKAIVPDLGKLQAVAITKAMRKEAVKGNKTGKSLSMQNLNTGKKGRTGVSGDNPSFEEIPMVMLDPEVRAKTLAIATTMLDKKKRNEMLESGVNRFMNNDDEELPDWFIKDERRNCVLQMPVTAAEVEFQRQRFRQLNERPSKKVQEAVARKHFRARKMLRKMVDKGKTDPRARDKANRLTVRKLMRSKSLNPGDKKKKGPVDPRKKGQMKRERQAMKKKGAKKKGR